MPASILLEAQDLEVQVRTLLMTMRTMLSGRLSAGRLRSSDYHHVLVAERPAHEDAPEADEPTHDADLSFGSFDIDDEDESAAPGHSWLGAMGQMIAALLVVVAFVALFIGAAVAFRWLVP